MGCLNEKCIIMAGYRVIVQYHIKKGMEKQAVRFFEKEMVKKALEYGSYGIELWQDPNDPTILFGTGVWSSLEEENRFIAQWESEMHEMRNYCVNDPTRIVYKIHGAW